MSFWIGVLVGIGIMLGIFGFGIYRFQKLTKNRTEQAMDIIKNFQIPKKVVEDDTKEQGTKEEGTKEE